MKKILKEVFGPVFLALLVGCLVGRYFYKIYRDNLYDDLSSSKLYLVENGEYDDVDEMRMDNASLNYVYYRDNDKYKTVVGITKEYDNINKIKELYDDKVSVIEYYIENNVLDSKQAEYDKQLMDAASVDDIKEVVDNILNLYRSDDNVRLIAID